MVVDEVDAEPGSEIEIRFHPGVDFEVQDGLVLLKGKSGKMALIPLSKEEFKLQPGKHASQYINATSSFRWIEYVDTEIESSENKTIVATLIVPVEDSGEAKQVAATKALKMEGSGDVAVSFSRKGEQYSFVFENKKGHLVLKK